MGKRSEQKSHRCVERLGRYRKSTKFHFWIPLSYPILTRRNQGIAIACIIAICRYFLPYSFNPSLNVPTVEKFIKQLLSTAQQKFFWSNKRIHRVWQTRCRKRGSAKDGKLLFQRIESCDLNGRGKRQNMKRTLKFTASVGFSVFSVAGFFGIGEACAQHPRILKRQVATPSCGCGQWTCPACQQNSDCTPLPFGGANSGVNSPNSSQEGAIPSPSDRSSPVPSIPPTSSESIPGAIEPSESNSPSNASGQSSATSGIDFNQIASNTRSSAGQQSSFGSSSYLNNAIEFQGDYFGGQVYSLNGTLIPSNNNGQLKLAENVSPIPRDRIFMNYSLFNRVPLTAEGIDVSRFSPGFEKTFLDKQASLEVRTPFSTTLDNSILTDGSTGTGKLQFGNIFLSLKGVLIGTESWAITGGTSLILPTAQDTRLINSNGLELLNISNQSVHLMPFLGAVVTPTSDCYIQSIVQIDTPLSGNSVFERSSDGEYFESGKLNNFTMLYSDIAMGYWLYRAPSQNRGGILGIIPTLELHWNQSLTNSDSVSTDFGTINGTVSKFQNFNITSGVTFQLPRKTRLALGYAVPVGNSQDQLFNSELRVMLNRYF